MCQICDVIVLNLIQSFLQAEIEKVKKRREQRALEKAQHEEEMVSFFRYKFMKLCWLVCDVCCFMPANMW